jgi:hypothetical protein
MLRSIPTELPSVKVDLDFSSIPSDNNLAELNDTVNDTIGETETLGFNIEKITSEVVNMGSEMDRNIDPLQNQSNIFNEIGKLIGVTNEGLESASSLSSQWGQTISPIQTQFDSLKTIIDTISATFGNLVSQTVNWVGQITGVPDLMQKAQSFIGNIFNGGNQQQNQQLGNLSNFVSPIQGKNIDELIKYQPSRQQGFYGIRDGGRRQHSKVDFDSRVGAGQGAVVLASMAGLAKMRQISSNSGGVDIQTKDSK